MDVSSSTVEIVAKIVANSSLTYLQALQNFPPLYQMILSFIPRSVYPHSDQLPTWKLSEDSLHAPSRLARLVTSLQDLLLIVAIGVGSERRS